MVLEQRQRLHFCGVTVLGKLARVRVRTRKVQTSSGNGNWPILLARTSALSCPSVSPAFSSI